MHTSIDDDKVRAETAFRKPAGGMGLSEQSNNFRFVWGLENNKYKGARTCRLSSTLCYKLSHNTPHLLNATAQDVFAYVLWSISVPKCLVQEDDRLYVWALPNPHLLTKTLSEMLYDQMTRNNRPAVLLILLLDPAIRSTEQLQMVEGYKL